MGNKSVSRKGSLKTVQSRNFIGSNSDMIIHDYVIEKVLGSGAYGVVRKGRNRATGTPVAIKKIKIRNGEIHQLAMKEFQILKDIDHPNIMKVYALYENRIAHQILVVTEYIEGGSLMESVAEMKTIMSQNRAASIMEEVLTGLAYLHSKKIVHRDLKPENIMLASRDSDDDFVKIVDFGLAQYAKSSLSEGAGTPLYIAPEIIQGKNYKEKVDIWSVGVITFVLLGGYPPFKGNSRGQLFSQIIKGKPKFIEYRWSNISKEAVDFIMSCLRPKPKERPSAKKLLEHPWITKYATKDQVNPEEEKKMITELKKFSGASILQHAVFNYISLTMVTAQQSAQFKELFQKLDTNKDGTITKEELSKGKSQEFVGIDLVCGHDEKHTSDIEEIIEGLDQDKNGKIEYTEFLAALLELNDKLSEEQLAQAFNFFDQSHSGSITLKDLEDVLLAAGKDEVEKIWLQILKEVDTNHDGMIQFEEFKNILKKDIIVPPQ